MTSCGVVVEGEKGKEVAQAARRGLIAFNEAKGPRTGRDRGRPGYWNVMHVERLWMADSRRGQGYDLKLMRAAEAEAKARGVEVIYLNSSSFQAPGFYEKLGYPRMGALEGVRKGESRIFYSKRLG